MKYDYLIVGAGLSGATFAWLAGRDGKKCLVIEKQGEVGGACATERVHDIMVHKHGPHIFHTDNRSVWKFIQYFGEMEPFINSPMAWYKGEAYNMPINMNTLHAMWGVFTPQEAMEELERQKVKCDNPDTLEKYALATVGKDIYEKLIKGYTEKQWGKPCSELPASIIKRIPIRFTYDNNYYSDRYQGVPSSGYTPIIRRMLMDADVEIGTDYLDHLERFSDLAKQIVYTGPIDELFDYRLGELEYRSLCFETIFMDDVDNLQGNAVVNYTGEDVSYTRAIEHKHFLKDDQKKPSTVISLEIPQRWGRGRERYYPIDTEANRRLYGQYREMVPDNMILLGRLAEYRYYDMDDAIMSAMDKYKSQNGGYLPVTWY